MGVVDFEDVAAGRSLYVDSETHSLLNDADVVGFDHHFTELGCDEQSSCLWDNEKVAVGVLHAFVIHGRVASVDVYGHSVSRRRMTSSAMSVQTLNEIHARIAFGWHVERLPSHLIGIGRIASPVDGEVAVIDGFERSVHDGWADAIQP